LNAARVSFGFSAYPREEVIKMVGHGLESLMEEAVGPERVEEGVRIFRDRYREISLAKSFLLPGAEKTLKTLHERGYRLAVLSNKPAFFSRRILDHLGVGHWIPVLYGPDLAAPKPAPEMVFRSLSDLGCALGEAILVGDMRVDRDTARVAGIPFYAVATGSESREELLSSGPDLFLDRLEDLLLLLPPLPPE
jgi:phosphoglycolate phosphatase